MRLRYVCAGSEIVRFGGCVRAESVLVAVGETFHQQTYCWKRVRVDMSGFGPAARW